MQIFLTIAISNASAERSFSTLKRVKNYLRNSLSQDLFCDLAVLNINSDLLNKMSFDDIINEFSAKKSRKKQL